jgi:hypothetical protein
MEQIDIWRLARLLMAEHGKRASEVASRRISELTMAGDDKGAAVWADILAAIASPRSQQPPPGSATH